MTYTVKALGDLTIFTTPAAKRKNIPFKAKWSATLEELGRELDHLDATDVVFEVAVSAAEVRRDGMLRANAKVTHPGVRISFQTRDHGPMSFTCDTYEGLYYSQMPDWQANVRAIVLTLAALRAVDRYGATKGEQYAGFAALPPGAGATAMGGMTRDQALGVLHEHGQFGVAANVDPHDAWRQARFFTHPDRNGGDQTLWDQVEQAARVLGLDR